MCLGYVWLYFSFAHVFLLFSDITPGTVVISERSLNSTLKEEHNTVSMLCYPPSIVWKNLLATFLNYVYKYSGSKLHAFVGVQISQIYYEVLLELLNEHCTNVENLELYLLQQHYLFT